jgi:hypothetical protein
VKRPARRSLAFPKLPNHRKLICLVQSLSVKLSASLSTQITCVLPVIPCPMRGAFRDRHGRWAREAVDATASSRVFTRGRTTELRTAKSRGPDAPTLASSGAEIFRAMMVAKKPGHQGEREVSRKTIAQGMPGVFRSACGDYPVCFLHCTRDCGCHGHPAFPEPSLEGPNEFAKLGRMVSRGCRDVSAIPLWPFFETPRKGAPPQDEVGKWSGTGPQGEECGNTARLEPWPPAVLVSRDDAVSGWDRDCSLHERSDMRVGKIPDIASLIRATTGPYSAAFAAFTPNIRVGAAKPHVVPSVTLTWSSHGKRNVPATMSCMKVYGQSIAPPFTAT